MDDINLNNFIKLIPQKKALVQPILTVIIIVNSNNNSIIMIICLVTISNWENCRKIAINIIKVNQIFIVFITKTIMIKKNN